MNQYMDTLTGGLKCEVSGKREFPAAADVRHLPLNIDIGSAHGKVMSIGELPLLSVFMIF